MHTELYCPSLATLDPVQAIRAIHRALLQLEARRNGVEVLDDRPAIESLKSVMASVGHPGFMEQGVGACDVAPVGGAIRPMV